MSVFEGIFGIKATLKGIELSPNIPSSWQEASCIRKYKNATYKVTYSRKAEGITVNGEAFGGKYLPYEDNAVYNVICGIK